MLTPVAAAIDAIVSPSWIFTYVGTAGVVCVVVAVPDVVASGSCPGSVGETGAVAGGDTGGAGGMIGVVSVGVSGMSAGKSSVVSVVSVVVDDSGVVVVRCGVVVGASGRTGLSPPPPLEITIRNAPTTSSASNPGST